MASVHFSLGGKDYSIGAPPYHEARTWRQQLRAPLDTMLEGLKRVEEMDLTHWEAISIQDILGLIRHALPTLINAPDVVHDLLLQWSPTLRIDQEFIDSTASDEELIAAFMQVLGQAYPLGALTTFLGPEKPSTSPNSLPRRGRGEAVPTS